LDSDVAIDKNIQVNAAALNTEGVLLIWNIFLYTIVYFTKLATLSFTKLARLCYADLIVSL
jgi:hypothetical protein